MRISQNEVESYCKQHSLCDEAADYVLNAYLQIARNPSSNGTMSVAVEFQSVKLGVTFNGEARTTEFSFATYLDNDNDAIVYFEQPPKIECMRTMKNGRVRTQEYTPDVLVLYKSGPVVVELKKEQELEGKIKENPTDWYREGEKIIDRPAFAAFEKIGLPHRVVSSSQLSQVRTANILLLQNAQERDPSLANSISKACQEEFKKTGVHSLATLCAVLGQQDVTPLLQLINAGVLHTDLNKSLLSDPNATLVTTNPILLCESVYSQWEADRSAVRVGKVGNIAVANYPPSSQLARAVKIQLDLDAGIKGRSARRWRAKILHGAESRLSALASVAPKNYLSGNRNKKRAEVVLAYAENHIRDIYASPKRPTNSACFRRYKTDAEDWHPFYSPVSKPTYYALIESLSQVLAQERGGNRANNAAESPSDVEERALRPTRPFELASCDHCLVKLYCVVMDANGRTYVDQPWLTVLRDCYTGAVLAIWLSFRPPSKKTCALIMRMCLRNHGRLPEMIIVDRGPEFRSVFFSSFLAHCRVHLAFRPKSHPRYGQEAETFFNQFKTLWLADRPGNKVLYKEARAVSGSHKPQNFAQMELVDLLQETLDFCRWNNNRATASRLESPLAMMARRLSLYSCSGKIVEYDDLFVLASCIESGSYEVNSRRGIHIGPYHYWSSRLISIALLQKKTEVRIDPENPYRIFARVFDEWVPCYSTGSNELALRDPIHQLAEGIRIVDCENARKIANADADRALVQALRKADERLATKSEQPTESMISNGTKQSAPVVDHFTAIKRLDIKPIQSTTWEEK